MGLHTPPTSGLAKLSTTQTKLSYQHMALSILNFTSKTSFQCGLTVLLMTLVLNFSGPTIKTKYIYIIL